MNSIKSFFSKNSSTSSKGLPSNRGRTTNTNNPPRPNLGPNLVTKAAPSKAPMHNNINFHPQSKEIKFKDFVSEPSKSDRDSSVDPMMSVSKVLDDFGRLKEIKILVNKEQLDILNEIGDFETYFGENVDEEIKRVIKEKKYSFVLLNKEQEEKLRKIMLEKLNGASSSSPNNNSIPSSSAQSSNVKITKDDVEFQDHWLGKVYELLKKYVPKANAYEDLQNFVISADLEKKINPKNNSVLKKFTDLYLSEIHSSKSEEKELIINKLLHLENLSKEDLHKSKFLHVICKYVIAFLEFDYPESLEDSYLWNSRLYIKDIQ